jgi:hypothetical protein
MSTDFGSVRIHDDSDAARSARSLHAQAYTIGNHIVFNSGKYDPYSEHGRRLLSHELVHVIQQRGQIVSLSNIQCAPEEEMQDPEVAGPAGPGKAAEEEEKAGKAEEKSAEPMSLPDFSTFGEPAIHTDFANNVTFKGQTDATFDGGVGQTKNLKAVPAKDCGGGCTDAECVNVTGTLEINYHVATTVTLPDVPAGLTPCQEKRVRDAINNKIKPHEDQHVGAFSTYNGAVKLPINFSGCKSDLAEHVQAMHDADAVARESAAKAKSAALDPFNVFVDLDCEDTPPKK